MPTGPRRSRRSAACAVVVLALLAALGQTSGGPGTLRELVFDLSFVVLPLVAAGFCWRAARRRDAGRASWLLLLAACTSWGAGSAVWAYEQLVLGDATPFPSLADVGYLAWPPLAVVALLRLPGVRTLRTDRLRLLCDGVVVAASLLVLAWLGALANLARAQDEPLAVALGLAFPVLDVLVGAVVLVVLVRLQGGLRDSRVQAAVAVGAVAVADALYALLAGQGAYVAGGPSDLLYIAAFLLLARAAGRAAAPDAGRAPVAVPSARALLVVPALFAGLALLVSGRMTAGLGPVLTVLCCVLVAALVARQQLLGLENDALSRGLEGKVAERTAALEAAHARASIDGLTGLPNRTAFAEALEAAVADDDGQVGLVLLDLDGFQEVNDGFGHEVGDALLVEVTARLRAVLRGDALLARLGGDEFAVVVRHPEAAELVRTVAERLVSAVARPLSLPGVQLVPCASAGTVVAGAGTAVHHLLRDADTALHVAKSAGRGLVRAFDESMHAAVRERVLLEADLREALARGELSVHYQPVVDLLADRVSGFEALARWTSPTRGPVPPDRFIPAAERSGLVVELERVVLELACSQVATWRRSAPSLTVAVNVSARHLSEPDFLGTVLTALARHGLPPSALVVEVTESLLFHDDEAVLGVLQRLHTAGIGLALDDFGTGYSSLSRLASYPFDVLKIDRAFVNRLDDGGAGSPVLVAALAMARGLGMTVVAEGVETADQLAFLLEHGCGAAQGYLLSRPGPADVVGAAIGQRFLPVPREPVDLPGPRSTAR